MVLVWDDTTTDTKLGLLKHAGGVQSTEVIDLLQTELICLCTQIGLGTLSLGMITVCGYGNDAKCVSHWRRGTYVSVLGNMGSLLVFLLRMLKYAIVISHMEDM